MKKYYKYLLIAIVLAITITFIPLLKSNAYVDTNNSSIEYLDFEFSTNTLNGLVSTRVIFTANTDYGDYDIIILNVDSDEIVFDSGIYDIPAGTQVAYNEFFANHDMPYNDLYEIQLRDTLDNSRITGVFFVPSQMNQLIDLQADNDVLYDNAYQDGYLQGDNDGYITGYAVGEADGLIDGFNDGYGDGISDGRAEFRSTNESRYEWTVDYAYSQGKLDAESEDDGERNLLVFTASILGVVLQFVLFIFSFEVLGISVLMVVAGLSVFVVTIIAFKFLF